MSVVVVIMSGGGYDIILVFPCRGMSEFDSSGVNECDCSAVG